MNAACRFKAVLVAASLALTVSCAAVPPQPAAANAAADPFADWLTGFRAEAAKSGISADTLDKAFAGVQPIERVIELDRRQPEFLLTFWTYFDRTVNDKRIQRGRELLKTHAKLLAEVEKKYGVPPRFLVAFWGLETNFGDYFGAFPLVGAVATLAYDPRRSGFFRQQLIAALQIIQRGDIPSDAKASWAGAMGNVQFIPTTYRDFAVDFDGDGKRDLWNSLPDTFGSAAHYLSRSGWQGEWTWGREVVLPQGFDWSLAGLDTKKPMDEWRKLGLKRADGRELASAPIDASLVLPAGAGGPAFLVYKNFRTILVWNRSILYALAVGHLADRFVGGGGIHAKRPVDDKALSRQDIIELQERLVALGFDTGGTDGVPGALTRKAIRAFQTSAKLPVDGHPTFGLLERLRGTGG